MAYIPGYCELSFANSNNSSTEWTDSTDDAKNFAISFGRSYIDSKYTCEDSSTWDTDDYTTIPDEVQLANSKLAERYVLGVFSPDIKQYAGPIVKKKVKAGSVESDTIYKGFYSQGGGNLYDENKEISIILSPYCTIGANSRTLIRV